MRYSPTIDVPSQVRRSAAFDGMTLLSNLLHSDFESTQPVVPSDAHNNKINCPTFGFFQSLSGIKRFNTDILHTLELYWLAKATNKNTEGHMTHHYCSISSYTKKCKLVLHRCKHWQNNTIFLVFFSAH